MSINTLIYKASLTNSSYNIYILYQCITIDCYENSFGNKIVSSQVSGSALNYIIYIELLYSGKTVNLCKTATLRKTKYWFSRLIIA